MKDISQKILIIWSGGAGLRCAIELRESGQEDILIIWDRAFDDAHTTQARGGINAALHTLDPEDTETIHAVDTYREWQYLAHPDLVEQLAHDAPDAIQDLLRRGADFHREDDGRLTQRFFWAHSYRRTVFSGDETGKEMIRVMSARARELQIPYMEHTYIYELLVADNTIYGALAIDTHTWQKYRLLADTLVLATWWYSNVYRRSSSRNKENFGDGIAMAFRAGAKIWDIELIQFHPTGLLYPQEKFGELVTEAMRWEWAFLLNSDGERFMATYDPEKLELSTRDVVARANFQEIQEWRGTHRWWVFLDISHRSKEYILERLPKMHSMILKYNNVDISKEPVEVAPTTHYTMWGIWFDPETMKTSIWWLYAAGECTMWVHGANRLWGNSLMETMVFGKKVAKAILEREFISHQETSPPAPLLQGEGRWLPTISPDGIDAQQTMIDIRKSVWALAGIVRNEEELQTLYTQLQDIQHIYTSQGIQSTWSDVDDVVLNNRLWSVLELALLIGKWALERKESRGAHYRSDYLEMEDMYSKNYMHMYRQGRLESSRQEIPQPSAELQSWLEQFERTKNYGHSE